MQLRAQRDRIDQVGIEFEGTRDLDGVIRDAHRVTARVRVLCFEREDEGVHPFEKQLLDAPGLRLDALLQALLVGAVFDDETPLVERL